MDLFDNPILAHVLFSLPPDTRSALTLASVERARCAAKPSLDFTKLNSTYSLVQVDRVFASDDVGDGATASLARGLVVLSGSRHFYRTEC
jgi:hypothetical protein